MRKLSQTFQNSEFTCNNASLSYWPVYGNWEGCFQNFKDQTENYSHGSLNRRKAVITESFRLISEIIRSYQRVVDRFVECYGISKLRGLLMPCTHQSLELNCCSHVCHQGLPYLCKAVDRKCSSPAMFFLSLIFRHVYLEA